MTKPKTRNKGDKVAWVIYSPPYSSDHFLFVGFSTEELARESFDEIVERRSISRTRGVHLIRLNKLNDADYALVINDDGGEYKPTSEELRQPVLNGFRDFSVTKMGIYQDSNDDWTKESLSAHGHLPEGVDYQVTP